MHLQVLDGGAVDAAPAVEDVGGVRRHHAVVDGVVVDQEDDGVGGGDLLGREIDQRDTAQRVVVHVGVDSPDSGSKGQELLGHLPAGDSRGSPVFFL